MLVFVARLRKKEIILHITLAKSVKKTKLQNWNIQSQHGFILATLNNEETSEACSYGCRITVAATGN